MLSISLGKKINKAHLQFTVSPFLGFLEVIEPSEHVEAFFRSPAGSHFNCVGAIELFYLKQHLRRRTRNELFVNSYHPM